MFPFEEVGRWWSSILAFYPTPPPLLFCENQKEKRALVEISKSESGEIAEYWDLSY